MSVCSAEICWNLWILAELFTGCWGHSNVCPIVADTVVVGLWIPIIKLSMFCISIFTPIYDYQLWNSSYSSSKVGYISMFMLFFLSCSFICYIYETICRQFSADKFAAVRSLFTFIMTLIKKILQYIGCNEMINWSSQIKITTVKWHHDIV